MKKVLSILLVLSMLLSLAACVGNNPAPVRTEGNDAPGTF